MRLWDNRDNLPEVENVRSYLLTALRRELFSEIKLSAWKTEKNRFISKSSEQVERSYEECIIDFQADNALRKKILTALKLLTEREKELIQLKFFDDLDYEEIAAQCNITKRTAYNIIHNALRTLRKEFSAGTANNWFSLAVIAQLMVISGSIFSHTAW